MANRYQNIVESLGCEFGTLPPGSYPEPLSEEQLDTLERELGHRLPDDYREFLRGYGGCDLAADFRMVEDGVPRDGSISGFYAGCSEGADIVEGYRLSLKSDATLPISMYPGYSLVRDVEDWEEEIAWVEELLAIGYDSGGNQICLALSGLRPGAIFLWTNAPGRNSQNVYLVTESFDEFIQLLRRVD